MTRINQIAQAFAAGVAFARSTGLAMDAAEEDKGYWRTIRGHKIHFGPDGKATNAPDWLKSSTRGTEKRGEPGDLDKALADFVNKYYRYIEDDIRQDFAQTNKSIDKFGDPDYKIPGADLFTEMKIKTGLNSIKNYAEAIADQTNMTTLEVATAAENEDLNKNGVENIYRKLQSIEKRAAELAGRTDTAMQGLNEHNSHEDAAQEIAKIKKALTELDRRSYDLYNEAVEAIKWTSEERRGR